MTTTWQGRNKIYGDMAWEFINVGCGTPRVYSTTSSVLTPNIDSYDQFNINL